MYILGIDIGTTNSKAGLFTMNGEAVSVASRPTESHMHADGFAYYNPEEMWSAVADLIREATAGVEPGQIACVGITSMAESGLLVDRNTGEPKSPFMPWFDTCSQAQAEQISKESDPLDRFRKSGLHNSFKLGLAKLLWIRERTPEALDNAVWLSTSSYIAYRLTGAMAFDYTLAARTYAFRIDTKQWDAEWLQQFGLSTELFPEAHPSGTVTGHVTSTAATQTGLKSGVPVAIGGHDHVCAALAVGAIVPEIVYDSMGTAETLVGTLPERPLSEHEFAAGMSFGLHIAPGKLFWMGGNASSGGSIEWLRGQLGEEPLPYEEMLALLRETVDEPTGILYYPYLTGSGAPKPNPQAKAAMIGLKKEHGRAELLKAVLEGTAYQLESIRREAAHIAGREINTMLVVGGGRRVPQWLQVKADITRCTLELPPISEATMLGAAMAAAVGCGVYASHEDAVKAIDRKESAFVKPDEARHLAYKALYEEGYEPLQQPLRAFYAKRL